MEIKPNETDRRVFIKKTIAAGIALSVFNPLFVLTAEDDDHERLKQLKKDFFHYACSGALFLYLNRNYGYSGTDKAYSVASLSGGIMQCGLQCGMLWGAALAAGAESYRRYKDLTEASVRTISASRLIIQSFAAKAEHVNCSEITRVDWSKKLSISRYLLTGKTFTCLNIAKKWAPKAIRAAEEGLSEPLSFLTGTPVSCAGEVAKRMGATPEETVMVAGFAGGYGLSGNGCGALGAAIWIKSLAWFKENPDSRDMYNPYALSVLEAFKAETRSEMVCHRICGRKFNTSEDHAEFLKEGGCSRIIEVLAEKHVAHKQNPFPVSGLHIYK